MTTPTRLLALLEQENGSGVLSGLGISKTDAETMIAETTAAQADRA